MDLTHSLKESILHGEQKKKIQQEEIDVPAQLHRSDIPKSAFNFLVYLASLPVQNIHPRPSKNISNLWKVGDVVVAFTNEYVSDVFRKLVRQNILSCPIVDTNGTFHGFIDMLTLTSHTLRLYEKWKSTSSLGTSVNEFFNLPQYDNTQIKDILEKPTWKSRNPIVPVFRNFSMLSVIEIMARFGARRIPVLDTKLENIRGLITQSMVISLIDQEMNSLDFLSDVPVAEMLPLLSKEIHTVSDNEIAGQAFHKMVELGITALPVVNSKGSFVDIISIRDLRGIGPSADYINLLSEPIKIFKQKCREFYPETTPESPVYVTLNATCCQLLSHFRDGNIHRVILCHRNDDSSLVPIAIVTQRDLLRFILFRMGMPPALFPDAAIRGTASHYIGSWSSSSSSSFVPTAVPTKETETAPISTTSTKLAASVNNSNVCGNESENVTKEECEKKECDSSELIDQSLNLQNIL